MPPNPQLFRFRTQAGHEVDLLLEDAAGRLVGIEVKASATAHSDDFKGLRVLATDTRKQFLRGIVLYLGNESVAFGPNLHAVPLEAIWKTSH